MMAWPEADRQARMSFYRSIFRPLLFKLSPDRSHELAHLALRWGMPWHALSAAARLDESYPVLRTNFAGLALESPVGLAAGFDKNAEIIDALSCLGFGFICVGSIMPEPRFGNPFPRLVRLEETESLIDSMGVPSRGREYVLQRLRGRKPCRVPVFANVGGFSSQTIAEGVLAVLPLVDAVEVSLMCPNVLAAGEHFDELAMLRGVLERVAGHTRSVVVRVPNDTTAAHDRFAELVEICAEAGVGGLKVGGGYAVAEKRLGSGRGTVHGRAIFKNALANVERAAGFAKGRIPIKGNGGISSAADVLAMLNAGAVCVDLYSAFIYQGWTVARDINRALAAALESDARNPKPSLPERLTAAELSNR
jgi:dihydroorotate dehydrogenase